MNVSKLVKFNARFIGFNPFTAMMSLESDQ